MYGIEQSVAINPEIACSLRSRQKLGPVGKKVAQCVPSNILMKLVGLDRKPARRDKPIGESAVRLPGAGLPLRPLQPVSRKAASSCSHRAGRASAP